MPWVSIIFLVIGAYVAVKLVQGIWDFVVWMRESRDLAALQEKTKELHRQGHFGKPPPLKERPSSSTTAVKPPLGGGRNKAGNGSPRIVK